MEMLSGIYKICNVINGNFYIGSSSNIYKRWKEHKRELRHNYHSNGHLQNAWNKYGENSFKFEILELVQPTPLALKTLEQKYIDELNPYYNIAKNVEVPMLGRNHSEETKKKMSESRTGIGNSFYGKTHSKETKEIISKSKQGKTWGTHSNYYKKFMSILQTGSKNSFYGKKHSEDAKNKISESSKNRIISSNTREKLSKLHRGENNYNSKLTDKMVHEIKLLWRTGEYSQVDIGKMYGVNNKIINNIIKLRTWKHVL